MRLPSLLLLLALFVIPAPAAAQTAIHHCIGSNGNPVFTDQPCAALQASPVSPSADASDAATQSTPPMLCAATRDDLRQSVIDAFARQDANRLAGLMLWGGYGHGAVIADVHALADLVRRPLLDIGFPGVSTPGRHAELSYDGTPPPPPPASAQLVLHTAGQASSGLPREQRFVLVRRAGCLWLRHVD